MLYRAGDSSESDGQLRRRQPSMRPSKSMILVTWVRLQPALVNDVKVQAGLARFWASINGRLEGCASIKSHVWASAVLEHVRVAPILAHAAWEAVVAVARELERQREHLHSLGILRRNTKETERNQSTNVYRSLSSFQMCNGARCGSRKGPQHSVTLKGASCRGPPHLQATLAGKTPALVTRR